MVSFRRERASCPARNVRKRQEHLKKGQGALDPKAFPHRKLKDPPLLLLSDFDSQYPFQELDGAQRNGISFTLEINQYSVY